VYKAVRKYGLFKFILKKRSLFMIAAGQQRAFKVQILIALNNSKPE
jgi:hypothetical protein